jgi:lipopolysaccharide export LptBFGC system permease protein LptF
MKFRPYTLRNAFFSAVCFFVFGLGSLFIRSQAQLTGELKTGKNGNVVINATSPGLFDFQLNQLLFLAIFCLTMSLVSACLFWNLKRKSK